VCFWPFLDWSIEKRGVKRKENGIETLSWELDLGHTANTEMKKKKIPEEKNKHPINKVWCCRLILI